MTNDICFEETERAEAHIASFGQGELVRTTAGRYELRGGTRVDLSEAREWASLFMPEVVIRGER
jgi:hypothetical protein